MPSPTNRSSPPRRRAAACTLPAPTRTATTLMRRFSINGGGCAACTALRLDRCARLSVFEKKRKSEKRKKAKFKVALLLPFVRGATHARRTHANRPARCRHAAHTVQAPSRPPQRSKHAAREHTPKRPRTRRAKNRAKKKKNEKKKREKKRKKRTLLIDVHGVCVRAVWFCAGAQLLVRQLTT